MDLLEQCKEWLKGQDFLAIIKALDTESDIELTPDYVRSGEMHSHRTKHS